MCTVSSRVRGDVVLSLRHLQCDGLRPIILPSGAEVNFNPQIVLKTTVSRNVLEAKSVTQYNTHTPYWATLPRVHAPAQTLEDVLGLTLDIGVYNMHTSAGPTPGLFGVARVFISKYVSMTPNDFVFFREPLFFAQQPAGFIQVRRVA
jgi:hypothetical protein